MNKSFFLTLMTFSFFLAGCAGSAPILPDQELRLKSADEIIKLGGDRYVNYDNKGAMKYYEKILQWYTNDREAIAWANYEIGFIYYQEGNEKKALEYFETVLVSDSPNPAPQILAAKVKDVINSRPPVLDVTATYDLGTNTVLKTDKKGMITVRLYNHGKGLVNRVKLEVDENKTTKGMFFTTPPAITMPVGSSNVFILPFSTDKSLETGKAHVVLSMADPRFTQFPKKFKLIIPTQGLPKPQLDIQDWQIIDYGTDTLSGNSNLIVNNGETAELRVWVTNKGLGIAYNVGVEVENAGSELVEIMSPISLLELGNIQPGESKVMSVVFNVPQDYRIKRNSPKKGAFKLKLTEDREFGQSSPVIRFPIIKLPVPVSTDTNSTNTD